MATNFEPSPFIADRYTGTQYLTSYLRGATLGFTIACVVIAFSKPKFYGKLFDLLYAFTSVVVALHSPVALLYDYLGWTSCFARVLIIYVLIYAGSVCYDYFQWTKCSAINSGKFVKYTVGCLFVGKICVVLLVLATAHLPYVDKTPGLQAGNGNCLTRLHPQYLLVEKIYTAMYNFITVSITYSSFIKTAFEGNETINMYGAFTKTIIPFLKSVR
jgi:hypothetical protein